MIVIFGSYARFGLDTGGLQIQVLRTADELTKLGAQVRFHNTWGDLDARADILHCFSIDASNLYLAQRAKKYGLKVILSPVLNAFAVSKSLLKLKVAASSLPGIYADYKIAKALFDISDLIIALNREESLLLHECFDVGMHKIVIIPNGVDSRFFGANPQLFQAKYPDLAPMVLQVASVEQRKNQLNVARAVKLLSGRTPPNFTYVNIGSVRDGSEAYASEIRDHDLPWVQLLSPIKHEDPLLPSAYAAADVFILPSFSEVMPLVLYEAAAAGCVLLVSDRIPIEPLLFEGVIRFDPRSVDSIADSIVRGLNDKQQNPMPRPIEGLRTWQQVALQIIKTCYEPAA